MKIKFITIFNKNIGSARIRVFNLIPMLRNYFEDVDVTNTESEIADDTNIVVFQKTVDYKLLYECRKRGIYTCFDIDDLFPQYYKMIKYVDLVIVSTEYLKNVLLKYNKNIIVVPNALDIDENINFVDKHKTDNINNNLSFGWYGWARNSKILEKIDIRQDVTVISESGDIIYNIETIDDDLRQFDYIVIPQNKTEHNLCKTHCRFLKAIYLGIPCLISDMPEYIKLVEEINYPNEYIIRDLNEFKLILYKIKTQEMILPQIDFNQVRKVIIEKYGSKNIAEVFHKKITEKYILRNIFNEKIKTIRLFIFYKKPLEYIFSVKNKLDGSKCRKVITFLGIKLKLRNKKKEQELKVIKLEQKLNDLSIKNKNLESIVESLTEQSQLKYDQLKLEYNKKFSKQEYVYNSRIDNITRGLQYKIHKYCPDEKRVEVLKDWYFENTGEFLDLENPETFNEKIQWLKLYDSTLLKTKLADKYLVRDWVKEKIGEEYLIPLLGVWDKFDDINFDELPQQFVLKCNHGSGYNIIVKDKSKLNLEEVKRKINTWMNEDFAFRAGFEMHYSAIPRKIIAEEYINPELSDIELQGWCLGNKLKFISYENCKDIEKPARCIFDRNWNVEDFQISPQHYKQFDKIPQKPDYLEEFLNICDLIANNFEHVRVDFIVIHNKLYFRELTFTSGSGLSTFEPMDIALKLGKEIKLNKKEGIVLCK